MEKSYKEIMPQIDTFILDVDGVLTDGKLHVTTDGQLLRQMNAKDGLAIKVALDKGYRVCIITGGNDPGVKQRIQDLGVTDVYMNAWHKTDSYNEYIDVYELNPSQISYMGDDLPDIPVMMEVALPTAPVDAAPEVQNQAKYISQRKGGEGCVRDLIEQVLRVRGDWPSMI
ncbi:MAG: KdsC family phosphatase [Flavobacteriaceae bacterium]